MSIITRARPPFEVGPALMRLALSCSIKVLSPSVNAAPILSLTVSVGSTPKSLHHIVVHRRCVRRVVWPLRAYSGHDVPAAPSRTAARCDAPSPRRLARL